MLLSVFSCQEINKRKKNCKTQKKKKKKKKKRKWANVKNQVKRLLHMTKTLSLSPK